MVVPVRIICILLPWHMKENKGLYFLYKSMSLEVYVCVRLLYQNVLCFMSRLSLGAARGGHLCVACLYLCKLACQIAGFCKKKNWFGGSGKAGFITLPAKVKLCSMEQPFFVFYWFTSCLNHNYVKTTRKKNLSTVAWQWGIIVDGMWLH